jgi:hypothetical protein
VRDELRLQTKDSLVRLALASLRTEPPDSSAGVIEDTADGDDELP